MTYWEEFVSGLITACDKEWYEKIEALGVAETNEMHAGLMR